MLITNLDPEKEKREKEDRQKEALKTAKRRAETARTDIKKVKPVLEILRKRNDKLELLLPFEKLQVLEKEIQILEARCKEIHYKYAVKVNETGEAEAQVIEEKWKKLNNKVDEKKREYYNIKIKAKKIRRKYSFTYELTEDPRVKPYEEFTGDFRVNKRTYKKPAFKYFPLKQNEIEKVLNKSGYRYSDEEIRKRDNAVQDLRYKLIEEENFLSDIG
ncbi:MAG: hypothetical protein K9K76_09165 [Halanaerobiales bacterium]|nr:hypothetical protein [Halanaerobiales bacterium]